MKKSIAFVLGLIFLSGVVVPFSLASRDAYHAYLTSQKNLKSFRYFTDGYSKFSRVTQVTDSNTKGVKAVRNLRFPVSGKRYLYSGGRPREESIGTFRPSTQATRTQWQNKLERRTANVQTIFEDFEFETYENEAFSLQLPEGWFNLEEKTHFFTNLEKDFTVSIKKFENSPCETIEGFTACAIALSKNENREAVEGEGKLLTTSRIIRQSRSSDTVLNELNIRTATYTENFNANFQEGEKHVSRYFVRDLDGGVYLIETITTPQKARKYVGVSKQIFDSFRIYSE